MHQSAPPSTSTTRILGSLTQSAVQSKARSQARATEVDFATAGHEFAQDLGLRIRQRPGAGPDRFGKQSDDARIEGIRLGELPRRPGEVPDLPWVDHRDWEPRARQRGRHSDLISAGGFENHDRWRAGHEALSEGNEAGLVVANAERLAGRAEVDIKALLGDVDADKQGVFHDPSLRMRALMAQATVRVR